MVAYRLYHMPGSCSQVVLNALEELGVGYEDKGVALMRGEHLRPPYAMINPKGKVPTLVADGIVVTELPVIICRLMRDYPDAGLLPVDRDGAVGLAGLSDMIWFSGALHDLVSRMFRPFVFSQVDPDGVKAIASDMLRKHAASISGRLAGDEWWFGAEWSIADVMIAWLFGGAETCGFATADFPPLLAHRERVQARPSYARAIERERRAVEQDTQESRAAVDA